MFYRFETTFDLLNYYILIHNCCPCTLGNLVTNRVEGERQYQMKRIGKQSYLQYPRIKPQFKIKLFRASTYGPVGTAEENTLRKQERVNYE